MSRAAEAAATATMSDVKEDTTVQDTNKAAGAEDNGPAELTLEKVAKDRKTYLSQATTVQTAKSVKTNRSK